MKTAHDEETIKHAAELLGVPTEGRYHRDILADVVLRLVEALKAEQEAAGD
jgi:hypothetical protein